MNPIIDRCNLGALPAKFSRLEQAPPDDWAQVPPALVKCATIPRIPRISVEVWRSGSAVCRNHPFVTLDEYIYAKQPYEEPLDADNWDPLILAQYESWHAGVPDEWRRAWVSESGGGGFTWQGLSPPPDHLQAECSINETMEDEGFSDWEFDQIGGEDYDFRISKTVPSSGAPGEPLAYGFRADFSLLEHNVEESDPITSAPAAPQPDGSDFVSALRNVTGYQGSTANNRAAENSRQRGTFHWEITADSLYSEEDWPRDEQGNLVSIDGSVRWRVIKEEEPVNGDGGWEEVDSEAFGEEFTVSPGEVWVGEDHIIDEAGRPGIRVRQTIEGEQALHTYPSAAMRDPDYTIFPYASGA